MWRRITTHKQADSNGTVVVRLWIVYMINPIYYNVGSNNGKKRLQYDVK